jgi:hypothetical protein
MKRVLEPEIVQELSALQAQHPPLIRMRAGQDWMVVHLRNFVMVAAAAAGVNQLIGKVKMRRAAHRGQP